MTKKTPGRPKKSQQEKAPKNGVRDRMYSITIHDIKPDTKEICNKRVCQMKPDWSLIGDEEYNHQDGHHLHVFLKYKEKKAFSKVLEYYQKFSEEFELGRVQVDHGRGSFEKCKKYLVNPDKAKKVDDNVIINVRKLTPDEIAEGLVTKYPDEVSNCQDCNKPVYTGPRVFLRNKSGQLIEVIPTVRCRACEKKISADISRRMFQATDREATG